MPFELTPEWATAGLTFVLAVITMVYAYLTKRIASANESVVRVMLEQTRQAQRPYVNIKSVLDPVSHVLRLRVENIGKSPANKLRLKIDRSFFQFAEQREERDLSKLHAFQNEIQTFPPGAELVFNLAMGHHVFNANSDPNITPTSFVVSAVYHGDEEYRETTLIDLRPHLMSAGPAIPLKQQLDKVHEELRRIANAVVQHQYREQETNFE